MDILPTSEQQTKPKLVPPVPNDFFVVWSARREKPPQKRHRDPAKAMTEAHRLSRVYPGHRFYVLQARANYWVQPLPQGEGV